MSSLLSGVDKKDLLVISFISCDTNSTHFLTEINTDDDGNYVICDGDCDGDGDGDGDI